MNEDEIKSSAEEILERARTVIDIAGVEIEVQVGDLSQLEPSDDHGGLACIISRYDHKAFIIAINPEAVSDPAGLEHIVMHEIVHVAHTMRCGDDDGETIEWLTDQLASFLQEKFL